jgi:hypothetical protein
MKENTFSQNKGRAKRVRIKNAMFFLFKEMQTR